MKRKMVYIGLSYISGLFFASLFSLKGEIFIVLGIVLLMSFVFRSKNIRFVYMIVCAVMFVSGFSAYRMYQKNVYDKIMQYDSADVFYSGKVKEIKNYADEKSRYIISGKINSSVKADISYYGQTLECDYNDNISFRCTLNSFENSFLFKEKDYYESNSIFLGTKDASDIKIEKDKDFSFVRSILRYSTYINEKISYILPGENGALMSAMLTGDKSGLDDSSLTALYRCGIGHMMAVSGMHLVFMVSFVSVFLNRAGLYGVFRFLLLEICIVLFVIFTGMSVSVMRAAFMITLINGASLFSRQPDPMSSLCTAAFVLVLTEPFLIKNSSFLLSVAGTFGASVFAPSVTECMSDKSFIDRCTKNLAVMFCITAVVFPFSVMFFDETSIISPLTNIVVAPLCMIVLGCGFMVAFCGGIDFVAYPAVIAGGLISKVILKISRFTAQLRFTMPLKTEHIAALSVFMTIFVCVTYLRYKKSSYVMLSLVLCISITAVCNAFYSYSQRDIISVYRTGNKKSAAIIIANGTNADIIDITGGAKSAEYVQKIVSSYNIRNINSVTFTHNPYQSMASYDSALRYEDVYNVYIPDKTYIYDKSRICGCIPEVMDMNDVQYVYDDYTISFDSKGEVTVKYGQTVIKCTALDVISENSNELYTEQNILLKADAYGNVDINYLE